MNKNSVHNYLHLLLLHSNETDGLIGMDVILESFCGSLGLRCGSQASLLALYVTNKWGEKLENLEV